MKNAPSNILIIALSISALALLWLCVNKNQRQAELQRSIASLQQEIKDLSPDSSASEKKGQTLTRPQKTLEQKNNATYKEIQDRNQSDLVSLESRQEITIQDLAEKDPEAYRNFMYCLSSTIKQWEKDRNELLNLMVSLKPNELLAEEDIEFFQDKIDENIQMLDADLAFQPHPKSKFVFESPGDSALFNQRLNGIIERYCATESGLDDIDLIQEMNHYLEMVQQPFFHCVLPILHREN